MRKSKRKATEEAGGTAKKGKESHKPQSTASTSSSISSFSKKCPPLTADERQLLADNEGCNRCRRF
jgi:hypothetical protein